MEYYSYYINLEERKERKENCIKQLEKIKMGNAKRFNAIKCDKGLIGCALSHIKILNIAKEEKLPYIIIFEDDVIFPDPQELKFRLKKYIDYDYDVLMIGAWFIGPKDYSIINEDILKVNKGRCAHAYIVKEHYYQILINNLKEGLKLKIKEKGYEGKYNNDEYWCILQEKDNWI